MEYSIFIAKLEQHLVYLYDTGGLTVFFLLMGLVVLGLFIQHMTCRKVKGKDWAIIDGEYVSGDKNA